MTEYERGFIDGIKSKVSAELTPTLINVSKTMLEMLKPVLSTALENVLNDNNAITDTDVQPVRCGRWLERHAIWIDLPEIEGWFVQAKCSECEKWAHVMNPYTKSVDYEYCPNCGARMIKEGEQT